VPVQWLLFCAGLLAGIWLQTLLALRYPFPLAAVLVFGSAACALTGSVRRPGFRSPELLKEAFLLLGCSALVLALLPELLQGWNSALALQGVDAGAESGASGIEVLWITVVFVVLGMGRAAWKYRNNG